MEFKQWGYSASGSSVSSCSFSISFSNTNYALVVTATDNATSNRDIYGVVVHSRTQSSFKIFVGANAGYLCQRRWIAIGVQQWGYAVEGTTKVSFPIVFNALFVVSNSQKYNAQSDDVDNILTTNNTYFTKSNLANAFAWWWIAIGKQQWRNSVAAKATFTYPITFSVVYAILLTSTGNNWCWASTITTSSAYNDNKSPSCFLGIGKQQWGYLTSSSVTFPVTFTTRYVYVIGDYRNGGTTSGQYHYVSSFTNSQLQATNLDSNQTKYFIVLGNQCNGV